MDAIEVALRKCLHVLVASNTITERKVTELVRCQRNRRLVLSTLTTLAKHRGVRGIAQR